MTLQPNFLGSIVISIQLRRNAQPGRRGAVNREKQKQKLREVVSRLEQTANNYFSIKDPEWNLLLRFRDKIKSHIEENY